MTLSQPGKKERRYVTRSEAETRQVGAALAAELAAGDVVALSGDLGAGKTCLVSGLAQGLGSRQAVSSPTFALVHEYPGPVMLYHLDLYRLRSAAEFEDLDPDAYFFGAGVTVVEWAERAWDLLPARRWEIRLEIGAGTQRRISITPPEGKRLEC